MKRIFLLVTLAISILTLNAQDILVRKGGEVKNVKILEVSPIEIKYKMSNNEDGPTFIEKRSNIYSIKFQNGDFQFFSEENNCTSFKKVSNQKLAKRRSVGIRNSNDSLMSASEEKSFYSVYGKEKVLTHEIDIYVQNGWGIGYQLRKEFNPYIGWNIIGISYMSGFCLPDEFGQVNLKMMGVRVYTPSHNTIRGYVDLHMVYTFAYKKEKSYAPYYEEKRNELDTNHHFSLDFSVGLQLHKKIAIGYNLSFGSSKGQWARIAILL